MQKSLVFMLWFLLALALNSCTAQISTDHWVVVSQAGSSTVAIIDPVLGSVVKRTEVGLLPHRLLLSADGLKLFAVLVGSQAIAELNTATFAVTKTMLTAPLPERRSDNSLITSHDSAVARAATSCFVCHNNTATSAQPRIVGERPFGLAFSDDQHLLVSHLREGRLSEIDLSSGNPSRQVLLAKHGDAVEASDLTRVGNQFVVNMRPKQPSTSAGAVLWLDQNLNVTLEQATGADPGSVITLFGRNSALVSNFETNTITEHSQQSIKSFTVEPGPLGTLQLDSHTVLSLNYYNNSVSILDLNNSKVENIKLELGGKTFVNPTHAVLSPDHLFAYIISSGTEGNLLVFDLVQRKVTRAVAIDGLSFDLVVVPVVRP